MDKILAKANELGLLIRDTEAARTFHDISLRVDSNSEASLLLKKYNELAETLKTMQESGFTIEKFESEQFVQLSKSVLSDSLLKDYIAARDRYMDMLVAINNQLSL